MKKIIITISLLILLATISFAQNIESTSTQVDSATALSDSVKLSKDYYLIGISLPASWTAANLTFQSWDSETSEWKNVYQYDGTELTYTAAASRYIIVKPVDFAGLQIFRLRSGTSGTPVNQATNRTISLVYREY